MAVTFTRTDGGSPKVAFTAARILLPETARRGVTAAANVTKKTILAGAPARLRGVGRSGAKLGVRYDVKGTLNPVAVVKATGPWQFVENDTKAHDIVPKTRRRRTNARSAVLTPRGPRRSVHHPGTKGKHPWAKGVDRATPAAVLAYAKVVEADLRKQFG